MRGFARDAPKAENGFVFVRIVSSLLGDETFGGKLQSFQMGRAVAQSGPVSAAQAPEACCAGARSHSCLPRFTCILRFSAEETRTRLGSSNRERVARDPCHRNRQARITTGWVHVREGHHDGERSRNGARRGPADRAHRSTPRSRRHGLGWRHGSAIEPRLRGRAAGVRAADRLAPRQIPRQPPTRH